MSVRSVTHWVTSPVRWLWRLALGVSALADAIRVASGHGRYADRPPYQPRGRDMRDDYDWPFRDKARPPVKRLSPPPTEQSPRLSIAKSRAKLENSPARPKQNRRRSDTVTDSTAQPTRSPMTPAVRTKPAAKPKASTAKKPAAKKTAAKSRSTSTAKTSAGHTDAVVLNLVKEPTGNGGYRYDDSHVFANEDDKLHRTTMYLSQATIKAVFNGKAPKTITFGG